MLLALASALGRSPGQRRLARGRRSISCRSFSICCRLVAAAARSSLLAGVVVGALHSPAGARLEWLILAVAFVAGAVLFGLAVLRGRGPRWRAAARLVAGIRAGRRRPPLSARRSCSPTACSRSPSADPAWRRGASAWSRRDDARRRPARWPGADGALRGRLAPAASAPRLRRRPRCRTRRASASAGRLDGVLAEEFDYLLARGGCRRSRACCARGRPWRATRAPAEPRRPSSGRPWRPASAASGTALRSLDSFRPAGTRNVARPQRPWRCWWAARGAAARSGRAPAAARNRRSAFTFWELSARGGAPAAGGRLVGDLSGRAASRTGGLARRLPAPRRRRARGGGAGRRAAR